MKAKITWMNLSALLLGFVLILMVTYQKFILIAILSWVAVSIGAIIKNKIKPKYNPEFLLMISLYLFYLAGILWSSNKDVAQMDLQFKLSLLLAPALFLFLRYDKRQLKLILSGFFLGLLFSLVYSLITSAINYLDSGMMSEFMFFFLSKTIPATYLAYYLNIAIAILLIDYITKRLTLFSNEKLYLLLIFTFSVFSFILLSRLGIVTTILLNGILAIHWMRKRQWIRSVLVVLFVALTPVILVKSSIWARERLWDELETERVNENHQINSFITLRKEIWSDALTVGMKSPLFGIGTGDTQAEMIKQYENDGFDQAIEADLNPHNQFLQTGIAIGGIGALLLICILMIPVFRLRRLYYFNFLFSAISFMFFMTESVLATQAGVVGFAFFYCLLFVIDEGLRPKEIKK